MEEKSSLGIGRFFSVLFSPGQVFQELVNRPAFLLPAFLICGVNLLLTWAMLPKLRAFTIWTLEHGVADVPAEQLESVRELALTSATAGSIVLALILPWVIWLVVACLFNIFGLFSTKKTSFRTLFAVAVYGYLPMLIAACISAPIVLSAPIESFSQTSLSLAVFLPYQRNFLYFFLAMCDPFTWWSLILWGIGGAAAMKEKAAGVIALLFGSWLVYAVLVALLTFMKSPVMG